VICVVSEAANLSVPFINRTKCACRKAVCLQLLGKHWIFRGCKDAPHSRSQEKDPQKGRGILKRDAALYPTLCEDKNWDDWKRALHAQARAHDVCEVLDKEYEPKYEDELALFSQKQSFMYSVFNRVILTDVGKTIVRQYEKTFDA